MKQVQRRSVPMQRGLGAAARAFFAMAAVAPAPAHAAEVVAPAGSIQVFRNGSQPSSKAPPEHFSGTVRVDPSFPVSGPAMINGGSVTFEPGARSDWHTHPAGQVLIVTAGVGCMQQAGGLMQEIRPGDFVVIPPNVKHWHGACPETAMTHMAIRATVDGRNVDWLEKVSDEQYRGELLRAPIPQ